MTVLPPPVRLDLPPEDPTALDELAAAVTGAAFHLGLLGGHLTAPAASVRAWVGRDAAAASAQVAVLGGLVRDERDAVSAAAAQLERHAGLARDAVARVRALRAAQREDLAIAVRRLHLLPAGPVDPPGVVAVVEDWQAAEAHRARAHAVLLAELADDAAQTAGALAGCTAVVGGTGAPGDDDRVVRHLAALLPGWGDLELAGRGRALAAALSGPVPRQRVDELTREATAWAAAPAYADAVLAVLGADGLRWLLSIAGDDARGADGPVAALLAGVLSAAGAGGAVPAARLVAPDDPDGAADVVLLGMASVLAAGARSGTGAPPAPVLASWATQLLARERAQQATVRERVPRALADGEDPVELVVGLLARTEDTGAAAALLAAPGTFAALLARAWPAGTGELAHLVGLAASAPGPDGAAAVHAGLAALGEGLAPGSAATWTVRRATAAAVAPGLAHALVAHAGLLADLLALAGTPGPPLPAPDDAALRGLGCLTWEAPAVRALGDALTGRLREGGAGGAAELGAFVAVQQYGQRLDHALAAAAAQAEAVDHAMWFQELLAPLRVAEELDRVPPLVQVPLDVGLDGVGHALGVDGSWTIGPDRGAVLTRQDAVARVLAAAGSGVGEPAGPVAAAGYDAALGRLGVPTGPTPPDWSWQQVVDDHLEDLVELQRERWARLAAD